MQTFLSQQLSLNTQGSLLLGFLSSPPSPTPLLLPFSSPRLPPSLSAKTIVTDYPRGSSRVRCRTPKRSVYLGIWITDGLKGAGSKWGDLGPWLQWNTVVASPIHSGLGKKIKIKATEVRFSQYKKIKLWRQELCICWVILLVHGEHITSMFCIFCAFWAALARIFEHFNTFWIFGSKRKIIEVCVYVLMCTCYDFRMRK